LSQSGAISISDCETASQGYLKLDKDGELVVNKQLSTQMLTCIQSSILD